MKILTLLVLALYCVPWVKGQNSWPDTPCTADRDCSPSTTRMVCEFNTCVCPYREQFHYGTLNKCLLPAEARCYSDTGPTDMTPNAECLRETSLIVRCKSTHPQTPTNTCARSVNEDCHSATDCDQDRFLQCNPTTQKCECQEGSIFLEGSCKLERNSPCDIKLITVPGPPVMQCAEEWACGHLPGMPDSHTICTCGKGLVENLKGDCVVPFGEECIAGNPERPCDEPGFQVCDEQLNPSQCSCKNPGDSFYHEKDMICKLLEGKSCSTNQGEQSCGSYSECKDGGNGELKCVCEDGLKSFGGKCFLEHDKPCIEDEKNPEFQPCNKDAFQDCISAKCMCAAEDEGDTSFDGDKCITRYGAYCGEDKAPCNAAGFQSCSSSKNYCDCIDPTNMEYDQRINICVLKLNATCGTDTGAVPCAEFSECGSDLKCICQAGLIENIYGECVIPYGGACDQNQGPYCNSEAFMFCKDDNKCGCWDNANERYNSSNGVCELLPGSPCDVQEWSQQCTAMTECKEVEGENKCTCLQDLIEIGKTCVVPYGGFCDDNDPNIPTCNSDAFQSCQLNHCACMNPESTWYNDATAQCETLIGKGPCNTGNQCSQGSTCDDATNTCTCPEGLTPSNDLRKCLISHGGACTTHDDCNSSEYLYCDDTSGKCTCYNEGSSAWFNPITNSCETLIQNGPCDNGPPCADTATCENDVCKCPGGAEGSADFKKCASPYGGSCSSDNGCDQGKFLECNTNDGVCKCKNEGTSTWYNVATLQCELLVENGPCQTGQKCSDNSYCDEITNNCRCPVGSDPSSSLKECLISHGGACSLHDDCNSEQYLTCDNTLGKCVCHNEGSLTWFDLKTSSCKTLIEQGFCDNGPPCADIAVCENDICKCPGSSVVSGDFKKCLSPYGGACASDDDCEQGQFLECNDNELVCKCKGEGTSTIYNTTREVCELVPGALCDASHGAPECTEMTECMDVEGLKKCTCLDGLIQTGNTCVVSYGGFCDDNDSNLPKCNSDSFLTCQSYHCSCSNPQSTWYNEATLQCELLVNNGPCKTGPKCSDLSLCDDATDSCTCPAESTPSSDLKKCLLSHGGTCSSQESCNGAEYLDCDDASGKCMCYNEGVQTWFNPDINSCETLIENGPCGNGPPCADIATCENDVCKCPGGAAGSADFKKCATPYGGSCSSDDNCEQGKFLECNSSVCKCKDEHVSSWFNAETNSCETLIDSPCGNGPPCTDIGSCESGVCKCPGGSAGSADFKKCVSPYGGTCSSDGNCNQDKFMECNSIGGVCKCSGEGALTWYDGTKCVILARGPCNADPSSQECVSFAQCTNDICECDFGLKFSDGKCVSPYDGACGTGKAPCDSIRFIECNGDSGKCDCVDVDSMLFYPPTETCYIMEGRQCQIGVGEPECEVPYQCKSEGNKYICK